MSGWYGEITLEPYGGSADAAIPALIESLGMNLHFDDVDCRSMRFCFRDGWDSPIVDYDVNDDELRAWFDGYAPLTLRAEPHDPSRYSDDLIWFE